MAIGYLGNRLLRLEAAKLKGTKIIGCLGERYLDNRVLR